VYNCFKTTSTRSAKSLALLKFLRKRSVDLWERSRSSRRSLTLGKPDCVVDGGSGSRVAVASDGGACNGVGSGGTGDMVWKYGVADDVDDIAIYRVYLLLMVSALGKYISPHRRWNATASKSRVSTATRAEN
jgi:hypothetical protein